MSEGKDKVTNVQQSADSGNGKTNQETVFENINNVAKALRVQLASSRPATGSGQKYVALIVGVLLALFCVAACTAAGVFFNFVADTLLKVEKGLRQLPTSLVTVMIVIFSLTFLAVVVALLIFMWKFYKHVDTALANEDARKIKEYQVYEQKLYEYYDKTLAKIWSEAYPEPKKEKKDEKKEDDNNKAS